MGTHRTESIAGVLARGVAAGPAFVAPPAARAELTSHVGGHPNNVQKALIERAARLTLYIEMMDRDALESGTMSEGNSRQYLAWVNALRLCLREIGVDKAKPEKPVSLEVIVSRHKNAASS